MATESSKMNANGAHDKDHEQEQNDPAAIRAEMQETRENLAETVSAIQQKLNPQRIREEAVGSVRRTTIGRVENAADDASEKVKGVGNDVFETIKRNPAPAVLAAVGLGWLFMESRNQSSSRQMERYGQGRRGREGDRYYYANEQFGRGGAEFGYAYDEYARRSFASEEPYMQDYRNEGQGVRERAGQVVGQAGSKVQDVASQAGSKVQDVAGQAADAVQGATETAKDTAGQVVDSARQGVQQVAYHAQYRAERAGSRFGEMMQENPLVIGAAAVALGATVGFAFSSTEKENEIMGEARDRVMDRAQAVASETAEKVQHVATEATSAAKEAAKDEAQKQNLASGTNR